jgi:methyl-accepting chemotaxis protein
MRTWTIGKKLYVNFGAIIVVMTVSAVVAITGVRAINAYMEDIGSATMERVELAMSIQGDLERSYSAQKSLIMSTAAGNQAEYDAQKKKVAEYTGSARAELDKLEPKLIAETGRKAAHTIREGFRRWDEHHKALIGMLEAGQPAEAISHFDNAGAAVRDPSREAIKVIVDNQQGYAHTQMESGRSARTMVYAAMAASGVFSVLLSIGAVFVVRNINRTLRGIAGELSQGAEQVSSASGQVSSASQSLSQGATEQAASLEQTSASMEEMASMTRKNAENSHQAASMMGETERLVHGANGALAGMVVSMGAIKEASDKVAKIIKTIDEIAFQTNILALNAAVEAARAGEAGMGFAVVADEVRALAQRSAQAAKDTAALIEESIAKSAEGQQKVSLVTGAIDSITGSTASVKRLVDEVSEASRQQAQGFDQVSQAIAQMEKVTQGTAATAEESAAASEELNAQAETAMQLVSRLASMVGGSAGVQTRAADSATPSAPSAPSMPSKVLSMTRRKNAPAPGALTPEEQIPLGDTGTYGSF